MVSASAVEVGVVLGVEMGMESGVETVGWDIDVGPGGGVCVGVEVEVVSASDTGSQAIQMRARTLKRSSTIPSRLYMKSFKSIRPSFSIQ